MLKKILFPILIYLIFVIPARAAAAEDFSQMNPTVKVTSYKKLYIDQILAYGSGSGTVVSSDGIIVTNHHVIFDDYEFKPLDAFEICITFDVKKEPVCKYTARLMAYDKEMDIALLKINKEDVFGTTVSALKYLDYDNSAVPKEQTEINVVGYPGSGGETITITKGQISGFEEYNDYKYFKTDTDFDHGSSGGTALDPSGNYIGIPTYIRSYAENVGFFLDLREARDWLDKNIGKTPEKDLEAEGYLEKELARLSKTNDELTYTQEDYPNIKVTLPEGWEFLEINDGNLFATQKNLSNPVSFSAYTATSPFEIGEGYLDKLSEDLEGIKDSYPDYKKEDVTFAGEKAWKVTYTSYSDFNTTYYIPYGYAMVGLSYSINLDEAEKQKAAIQPVLESFGFAKSAVKDPSLPSSISFDEPPFEISASGDWRIQKNKNKESDTLLAEAIEKDNFEGSFTIYYSQVPKDEKHRTAKERLDDIVKYSSRKLIYKNDEVALGGLEGFLYTYEYEGSKYQQIRKRFNLKLRDGDYEFAIAYDDLTDDFDRNLPAVSKMLDSFLFKGETEKDTSVYSYGSLGFTFNDIQYHRYAQAIGDLAEKGIVKGYADGGFHPEQLVARAEALKMILESKNHLENEKDSKKTVDFTEYEKAKPSFGDVASSHALLKYVQYAYEKKFVKGYAGNLFKPNQSVSLAEALKLIISAYEIPVWSGETKPWYKKYMDKGYELGLIPYGLYEPDHLLTRAELAELVSSVYGQAEY